MILSPGASISVAHEGDYEIRRVLYLALTPCATGGTLLQLYRDGSRLVRFHSIGGFHRRRPRWHFAGDQRKNGKHLVYLNGTLSYANGLSWQSLGGHAPGSGDHELFKRASFVGCSANQQSTTQIAIANAEVLVTNVVNELQTYSTPSTIETTWFGNLTSPRRTRLIAGYTKLETAPSTWTYDCTSSVFNFTFRMPSSTHYRIDALQIPEREEDIYLFRSVINSPLCV